MKRDIIKVFLGGPNDSLIYLRQVEGCLKILGQALDDRCELKTFYWNSKTNRIISDIKEPVQKRIDGGEITPATCDLMIMLFHKHPGTPCTTGTPPKLYCSYSAYEIETALSRDPPPKIVLVRDEIDLSIVLEPSQSDPDIQQVLKERNKNLESKRQLDSFISQLKSKDCNVQLLTFSAQLENSLPKLLKTLIDEVLDQRRGSNTPLFATAPPPRFLGYPYRGLDELDVSDGDIFFGREVEQAALLDRLSDPEVRLQCIHGPSGVGKSSLLKAGALHQIIKRKALGNNRSWTWSLFKPSDANADPFVAMAMSFVTADGTPISGDRDALADALRAGSRQSAEEAGRAIREALLSKVPHDQNHGILIAINQLEELWTAASSWIDPLLTFIQAAESNDRLRIITTIRNDLLGTFANAPQIAPILQKPKAYLLPIGGARLDQLEAIVHKPAEIIAPPIRFEEGFVGRILVDARDFGDAALPIISFMLRTLRETFGHDDEPNQYFRISDYEELGGLESVIQNLVKRVVTPSRPELLSRLFSKLADVHDGRPTIITCSRSQLIDLDPDIAQLIDSLANKARVLHVGEETHPGSGDVTVRIAHEALFRQWPDLKDWVEHNHLDLSIRDELQRDSHIWATRGRRTADIKLRPERLDEIDELARNKPALFDHHPVISDYLKACRIRRERETLISAIKGGHVTSAFASIRKLTDLNVFPLLEESDRGTEPHQLRPAFWAAITGNDEEPIDSFRQRTSFKGRPRRSLFEVKQGRIEIGRMLGRGFTPLFWAAICGREALVHRLVAKGADPNKLDDEGGTILNSAAVGGHLETIAYLVDEVRMDPLAVSRGESPPILWAIQERHNKLVDFFQSRGQKLDFKTADGWNSLTEAVRADDTRFVQYLIDECRQNSNYRTKARYTLIHIACQYDRNRADTANVAALLISKYRADIFSTTREKMTPLHFAAHDGKLAAIDILISAATTMNRLTELLEARDNCGMTALQTASSNRHPGAIEKLLAAGANANVTDDHGNSPLTFAVVVGDRRCAQLLLDGGARTDLFASDSWPPLHFAADDGDLDMVERLLKAPMNVDLNATVEPGWTAMMVAARKNHFEIVDTLLRAGADPSVADKYHHDVLQVAYRFGHRALVNYLKHWSKDRREMTASMQRQEARERHAAIAETSASATSSRMRDSSGVGGTMGTPALRTAITELSPLEAAAAADDIDALRSSLSKGFSSNAACEALRTAASYGHSTMVEVLLINASAEIDSSARTVAATAAAQAGKTATARLLVSAGASEPTLWNRPRVSEAAWFLKFSDLNSTSARQVVSDLSDTVGGIVAASDNCHVRGAELDFLPGKRLLAIEDLATPGQNEQFIIERHGERAVILNWTNEPIYNLFSEGPSTLEGDALFSYVRFFFHFVRGHLGRFILADGKPYIPWSSLTGEADKLRVTSRIEPMRIKRRARRKITLAGSVVFKNALFLTDIELALDDKQRRGELALKNERLLLEDLPIQIDTAPGVFG